MSEAARRSIPVLVVLPPRTLLLDLAGPVEVLRIAGAVQERVAFAVRYVAPDPYTRCSIGLALSGAEPLPEAIAPGTVVLLPGASSRVLGREADPDDAAAEARIVDWLRGAVRPG
ncbi:GlxA family transcriptional regulator, partial [Methylobacterium sp. WL7]